MVSEYKANLSSQEKLSILRKRNIDKTIAAHFNIYSWKNSFGSFIGPITGNIDILMVSERKLDESFPIGQFIIEGLFVREDVLQNLFL